jgi:ATP-dependent helicase/nuclease subunit A
MAATFTDQQRAAVGRRGCSIVLASGAGCGKTFVLTARYLSHLTTDAAEVGQVVAITFTERAAREMRGRIRAAVEERLGAADPASEAFVQWQQHKRNLDTAPINTIHGFCGTLLRQYGAAIGLDPTFDVLDEPLAATLRAEALRDELYRLLTDQSDAGADLRELVVLFGWHATRDAVEELLLDPDPPAWVRWLARDPADLAAAWLGPERGKLLPDWVGYLCAASPKVAPCLNLLARVSPATPEAKSTVARLLAEVPRLHEATDLAGTVAELCELAKISHTGKKGWPDEETYAAVRDAFTAFRGDLEKRFALFTEEPEGVGEAARVGQRFLHVATAADAAYRARKTRAAALDFHDLLVLARDLLKQSEEVRSAVRERFRFILLDELQDTDPVQMELVELLCGGGLIHGKLFAVGDS